MQIRCANRNCGLIHDHTDRIEGPREGISTKIICPRCGGDTYCKAKPCEVEKRKSGAQLIALERTRQMVAEGWTPEHDDTHKKCELALAAVSYISAVATPDEEGDDNGKPRPCHDWPWSKKWWKPSHDPIRNLVKAGALIAAEIDRLQRLKNG